MIYGSEDQCKTNESSIISVQNSINYLNKTLDLAVDDELNELNEEE